MQIPDWQADGSACPSQPKQVPHDPPTPLSPHSLPAHGLVPVMQIPTLQYWPDGQVPHDPPQVSSPHLLMPHDG